jgi:hypothetical protein
VELYGNNATCSELTVLTGGFDSLECDKGVTDPKPRGWISRTNFQGDYYAAPQLTLNKRGKSTETVTLFAFGNKSDIQVSSVDCHDGFVTLTNKDGSKKTINTTELHAKANIQ